MLQAAPLEAATVTCKNAECECAVTEKKLACREHEATLELDRRQERTQCEKDLAMLAVNRKVAVANAKLKAIENAIEEEECEGKCVIPWIPVRTQERKIGF